MEITHRPSFLVKRRAALDAALTAMTGLDDNTLAICLLDLARRARTEFPGLADAKGDSVEHRLLWQIVPEIARRLGGVSLSPREATCAVVTGASDADLRLIAGQALEYATLRYEALVRAHREKSPEPLAAEILDADVATGNPIALALERLSPVADPALADPFDFIARMRPPSSRLAAAQPDAPVRA